MHREAARIEMKQWRQRIEHDRSPGSTISVAGKAVRPRVKKRYSGAAPARSGGFELFYSPQNLHASMTE